MPRYSNPAKQITTTLRSVVVFRDLPVYRSLSTFVGFLILLTSSPALAQSVRVLSTKDGLPQSFVSALLQDDNGFIWIGTRNGIARYDGISYKVFQHDLHDTSSVSSNVIIWMTLDKHNHLWIEYESGAIDRMDPVTEKIEHKMARHAFRGGEVPFVRKGWWVDRQGYFWGIIKAGGLSRVDSSFGSTNRYTRASHGFASDTLRGLLEDRKGTLWVLSQGDISSLNRSAQSFTHWTVPRRQDFNHFFDSEEEVVDLHERSNGEIMWGDCQRLIFFDPVRHSFRDLPLPGHSKTGIRWIRSGPEGMDYFESEGLLYSYDDRHGLVKIGSAGMNSPSDARSFLVDHSSLVWIGTNAGGIHQMDLTTPFFPSFHYRQGFFEDLLGQELGLSLNRLFSWTPKDQQFSAAGYHFRSVYDARGRLWMGLKESVCCYDSSLKTCTPLPRAPLVTDPTELGIPLKGVTITPEGAPMIVGYNSHILVYDSARKSWDPFVEPGLIRKTFGSAILPQDILADSEKVWITTANDGLLFIDSKTKQINQLKAGTGKGSLPTNQLLGFRPDPKRPDLLWIGSYQGLICLDKKTLQCQVFSLEQGLPDNTVYSIESDNSGDLWFSTNKGLCRFDPLKHLIRVFRTSYGLPGDEFNRFHHYKLPDGRLAFGGTDGWTLFNPLSVMNDDFEPEIAFTDYKVNNNAILPGSSGRSLPYPLNAVQQLNLSYDQNTLTLGFAGLQFNQPQDLSYRYRLTGYDEGWVLAGHTPVANYTKIPPGRYTLEINTSNSTGRWSSHTRKLSIVIAAPWWKRWWAWLCYGLILAGITWSYVRYRVRQGLLRQEMLLKEKEAAQLKELDEMKTRFFSNVTHEFRTPLTLIMGPARQLRTLHEEDPQQVSLTGIIEKNAEHMLGLINQLMDLSKLEAKALKLQERRGSVAATIGAVASSFENEAQSRGVRLIVDLPEATSGDYWFAPDALERIVYNLVSNALKFTPEKGLVEITLFSMQDGVELTIKDTGTGIAASQTPYIFDRFYQAGDNASGLSSDHPGQEGTGLGLALVKELVDLQNGTIEVESRQARPGRPASGTTFVVWLPYRLAGPDTEEDGIAVEEIKASLPKGIEARPHEEKDAGPDEEHEAGPDADTRPLVLVVEDHADLAGYISGNLFKSYRVNHVDNGALGLQTALETMPDLIVSDVRMPVMDGFELCGRLKSDLRTSHIPVILLTAKATQESRIEGLSRGADDYLTKPFHPTELLLRIHNLLEQRQRLRERIRQEMGQLVPGKPADAGQSASETPPASETSRPTSETSRPASETGPPSSETAATVSASSTSSDPFLEKIWQIVEERLDDPLFGVEELLIRLEMSRTSLHRKIKALTSCSTSELVRNYRLKRAAQFLQEGYGSTDTAYKSGFGSPAYFTRCFRELYGITPGEYIQTQKK